MIIFPIINPFPTRKMEKREIKTKHDILLNIVSSYPAALLSVTRNVDDFALATNSNISNKEYLEIIKERQEKKVELVEDLNKRYMSLIDNLSTNPNNKDSDN